MNAGKDLDPFALINLVDKKLTCRHPPCPPFCKPATIHLAHPADDHHTASGRRPAGDIRLAWHSRGFRPGPAAA